MPILMRLLIAASALAAVTSAPAIGGETPWQEVAPGVKLRLISTGQIKADGTTLIGLEIDMPANTKTYWRVPGDTGFPAELNLAGSSGVSGHEILWPYPTRAETEDYLDYVYYGPVVLPVEVSVDAERPQLELAALLGVCSEICVPAQAKFSLALADAEPDRPNGLRIRQALASVPIPWADDPQPVGDVELQSDAMALAVSIGDAGVDPASLIASTPDGEPLFGTPQKSPQSNLVLIPILADGDAVDLAGQEVQLTFMTDMGAFEVTRTVSDQQD